MGARPLKRAIDQYVIAPLAATIVERRFPEGDQFVFVKSDGRAIQAEFVDPDADAGADIAELDAGAPGLLSIVLKPTGSAAELVTLSAELQAIEQSLASAEWEALRLGWRRRCPAPISGKIRGGTQRWPVSRCWTASGLP
jgi:ATP-dependent Clp protease ATP-binding subunit ClpC